MNVCHLDCFSRMLTVADTLDKQFALAAEKNYVHAFPDAVGVWNELIANRSHFIKMNTDGSVWINEYFRKDGRSKIMYLPDELNRALEFLTEYRNDFPAPYPVCARETILECALRRRSGLGRMVKKKILKPFIRLYDESDPDRYEIAENIRVMLRGLPSEIMNLRCFRRLWMATDFRVGLTPSPCEAEYLDLLPREVPLNIRWTSRFVLFSFDFKKNEALSLFDFQNDGDISLLVPDVKRLCVTIDTLSTDVDIERDDYVVIELEPDSPDSFEIRINLTGFRYRVHWNGTVETVP